MSPSAKEPKEEKQAEQAEEAPKEKAAKKSSAKKGNVDKVIELIEKMTFLEVAELVTEMEDKFGVSAAAPAMMAAPAAGDAAPVAEAQTEFDIHLTAVGDKKIQVIKVVRSILPQLGLKEAKDLVDKAPTVVKEGITKEEAEEIKTKLEEVGAQIDVK